MRNVTRSMVAGVAVAGVAAAGVAAVLRPGTRANRMVRRALIRAGGRLRYAEGRVQGMTYRLSGRRPSPDVVDNVLADRVRSTLGPLERRLDLPRVHVMVERHVALLHGEVGSEDDANEIERAVKDVSGVAGVESYLHVGLVRSDTRPSQGRAVHQPSAALAGLLGAAERAGVDASAAKLVVRGVLSTFADRLPAAEREHVLAHLPPDIRTLFAPPRRIAGARLPRTAADLVGRIAATTSGLPLERAAAVTETIVHELKSLVPDEARDVAAVLPPGLRPLWDGAA